MSEQNNGHNGENGNGRRKAYFFSATIALILALLTVIEFFIGVGFPNTGILLLLAAVKAYLVVYFYMHIKRLWTPEGEH